MKEHSAGIVVYRQTGEQPEVLLAHMGGPFHAKKDDGHWTIPKGLIDEGEEPLAAAKREFTEELGLVVPSGNYLELGDIEQHNKKIVTAWAIEADLNASEIKSNMFEMEWPPRSGQQQEFPEIDRAAWFDLPTASQKAIPGQDRLFERLAQKIGLTFEPKPPAESSQSSLF